MKRWINHPLAPVFTTAVIWYVFIASYLAIVDYDLSRFIAAGDRFTSRNDIHVTAGDGYDGQFYYRLAIEPFTQEKDEHGVILGAPRYRQQRILYPLVAHVLTLGRVRLLPFGLVAVNFLALTLLAWGGGELAHEHGRFRMWGVVFALWPGFIFTVTRNLTEVVEIAFLLIGLLSYKKQRYGWTGVALALAILGKETALLAPFSIALALLWQRTLDRRWTAVLIPFAVTGIWQLWLLSVWGIGAGTGNIGRPFVGVVSFWQRIWRHAGLYESVWRWELVGLLVLGTGVLWAWRHTRARTHVKLAWLLYTLLLIVLTGSVWVEDVAFMRAAGEWGALGLLVVMATPGRLWGGVGAGVAWWWWRMARFWLEVEQP